VCDAEYHQLPGHKYVDVSEKPIIADVLESRLMFSDATMSVFFDSLVSFIFTYLPSQLCV